MRITMIRPLRIAGALATATVLGMTALTAATAQTSDSQSDQMNRPMPSEMTSQEIANALASCPNPNNATDGSGRYNIIDQHDPGQRILLRAGTPSWGLTHIKKRYYEGATNHEWTSYAKDLWMDAFAAQLWIEKSPCYFIMRKNYATPGGQIRTMCVYFDFKAYGGHGSRGVATAFWIKGIPACPGA